MRVRDHIHEVSRIHHRSRKRNSHELEQDKSDIEMRTITISQRHQIVFELRELLSTIYQRLLQDRVIINETDQEECKISMIQ